MGRDRAAESILAKAIGLDEDYDGDMRIWKVDDGAWHWVQAESETLALAMWEIHLRDQWGMPSRDLDGDDPPSVEQVSVSKARGTALREDDGTVIGSMWDEYLRDPSRRYVACSEC